MDGAGAWRSFWSVTLPLITPTIFFNLVLSIIATFQTFTSAFVATNGGPLDSTLFYVLYLYRQAFQYFAMGYAAALAWVLFVIILLLTLLWLSARWERDVIRAYLADEVGISVTPEEYARIQQDRLFSSVRRVRGAAARVANAQNELAFRKWHVAREGGDPNADPLVLAWREDIAALRADTKPMPVADS